MDNKEHIHNLMSSIGPQLDLEEVVEFGDECIWSLAFDDDVEIEASYVEEHDRLYLSAQLGKLGPGRELEMCKLLLRYNYLWEQTGGARMALDSNDGEVVLVVDVAADLELPTLQFYLENLQAVILPWRQLFQQASEETPPLPDRLDEMALFNGIRV